MNLPKNACVTQYWIQKNIHHFGYVVGGIVSEISNVSERVLEEQAGVWISNTGEMYDHRYNIVLDREKE